MRKADQEWLKDLAGTPLPLETGVALYRAYRRLPIAHRMALVRAALENETAFTLDELNSTNVGKIDQPSWSRTGRRRFERGVRCRSNLQHSKSKCWRIARKKLSITSWLGHRATD